MTQVFQDVSELEDALSTIKKSLISTLYLQRNRVGILTSSLYYNNLNNEKDSNLLKLTIALLHNVIALRCFLFPYLT